MKAKTHYVFSAGAGLYILSLTGTLSIGSAILVVWLSFVVNFLIDALGHSRGKTGNPSRTLLTHSVFTAPLWGAASGYLTVYALSRVEGPSTDTTYLALWTAVGAFIAFGHLFLDSLTQAGVYYWRSRIAIAHFAYDNPLLNAGFILIGAGLCLLALLHHVPITESSIGQLLP